MFIQKILTAVSLVLILGTAQAENLGDALDYQQEIFNNMAKAAGVTDVTFQVDYDGHGPGAFYQPGTKTLILNSGDFYFVDFDSDEIASSIGHELGHYLIIKNSKWTDYNCRKKGGDNKVCERLSDIVGQVLMHKAGYDMCKAGKYWSRFMKLTKSKDGGDDHPDHDVRLKYMNCKTGPAMEYIKFKKIKKGRLK